MTLIHKNMNILQYHLRNCDDRLPIYSDLAASTAERKRKVEDDDEEKEPVKPTRKDRRIFNIPKNQQNIEERKEEESWDNVSKNEFIFCQNIFFYRIKLKMKL